MYCLNFISRIAQCEHTCACTRCCAAAHVLRTEYVYQTTSGKEGRVRGTVAGCRGGGRKTPSGKPGGNTGSRAQAVPSALVIFPFYAFHSFVSLRMPASACCCTSVCVLAGGSAALLKEEGTVRYVRHRPGGIS